MRNWKLFSGIVIFITILVLIFGAQSCSFLTEPDHDDITALCQKTAEIDYASLYGMWTTQGFSIDLTAEDYEGLRKCTRHKPPHEPVNLLYGLYYVEHPIMAPENDVVISRGVLHTESYHGQFGDYRYRLVTRDSLWLQDEQGVVYLLKRN